MKNLRFEDLRQQGQLFHAMKKPDELGGCSVTWKKGGAPWVRLMIDKKGRGNRDIQGPQNSPVYYRLVSRQPLSWNAYDLIQIGASFYQSLQAEPFEQKQGCFYYNVRFYDQEVSCP
jgi:hypothetical protein